MVEKLGKLTILDDTDFDAMFNDENLGDWRHCMDSVYAKTVRVLDLLDTWKQHLSLIDTMEVMWEICFDVYFDEKGQYIPSSFCDFCMSVLTAIGDTVEE